MQQITTEDLNLITNLASRTYVGNQLLSNATPQEKLHLEGVINKLEEYSEFFAEQYDTHYGNFVVTVPSGNQIAIGGTRLKPVWSGIYKGATNKQYAAQISFVINPADSCLDVGFYFGRAAGHSITAEQRPVMQEALRQIAISLSASIRNSTELQERYDALFDFGFKAFVGTDEVLPNDWLNLITIWPNTKKSQIIAKIYPNSFGVIEHSTIDVFVSKVIFLMGTIPNINEPLGPIIAIPLTPEQRAKEAERLALIGQKGELYVMQYESERLTELGLHLLGYPRHVALESMSYGYDILSIDENRNEIFIEVKTTTRKMEDRESKKFFVSNNEFKVFSDNMAIYKLYRVFDIDNTPLISILNLDGMTHYPDGYIFKID